MEPVPAPAPAKSFFNWNVPFLTFIGRTYLLLVFSLFTNWLVNWQHTFEFLGTWEFDEMKGMVLKPHTIFEHFGAIMYVPPFTTAVVWFALLIIHLFFRETIDKDAHDGTYLADWGKCSEFQRVLIGTIVRVGIILALCILCSGLAKGADVPRVDQVARWKSAALNPRWSIALDVAVKSYQRNQRRYEAIQAMRANGVPAPVLFCLHYRESDNDFRCHAHEGSPLTHRTRDVPRGRLPTPEPPYSFEQSAEDAYYVCERPPLDKINWGDLQAALDKMESFNGYGYRRKGIWAPYLFSGTTGYRSGKYVRDGVYSASAVDKQAGCVAILKRMQQRGVAVPAVFFVN